MSSREPASSKPKPVPTHQTPSSAPSVAKHERYQPPRSQNALGNRKDNRAMILLLAIPSLLAWPFVSFGSRAPQVCCIGITSGRPAPAVCKEALGRIASISYGTFQIRKPCASLKPYTLKALKTLKPRNKRPHKTG